MEYRRSRRRTNKKTSTGAGKTVVILILLAAGVYFISISAVGSWLSKHIVEPVFSAFMSEKKESPANSDDSMSTMNINDDVKLPKLECFMLQMGVFDSESNANTLAESVRQKGGAGYVMRDGEKYRVLAAGYATQEEACSVRDRLKSEGYDCSVHEITTETTDFSVSVMSGTNNTIENLKSAFYALLSAHDDLLELELNFDKSSMTAENGKAAVSTILSQLQSSSSGLKNLPTEITGCIESYEAALEKLKNANTDSAEEFSSMIKYAQASCACEFMNMVKSLVG